jgi:hypothetical protein
LGAGVFSRLRWRQRSALGQAASFLAAYGRLISLFAIAFVVSSLAAIARADTIAQYVGGTYETVVVSGSYLGQSVTTTGGGPWNNITLNFYDSSTNNPYAIGNIYLLNQEYTGSPSGLSASTTGYLGEGTASGGVWVFDASTTLQPNTQYFFYQDGNTSFNTSIFFGTSYTGGTVYENSCSGDYCSTGGDSLNFTVSGSPTSAPAPIPGAGLLSYLLVGFGGLVRFRKKIARLRCGVACGVDDALARHRLTEFWRAAAVAAPVERRRGVFALLH